MYVCIVVSNMNPGLYRGDFSGVLSSLGQRRSPVFVFHRLEDCRVGAPAMTSILATDIRRAATISCVGSRGRLLKRRASQRGIIKQNTFLIIALGQERLISLTET